MNIIIASIKDALSKPILAGYMLTEGRKIKKIPEEKKDYEKDRNYI